jgi:dynein heavy chain, axonemal
MNQLDRMRQVRQNCVLARDNQGQDRYSALSGLLNNFLTLEKSLNSYLDGKKMSFPRFYSLSEEDILAILGSSKPDTIQPYLLKLFDACKMLTFEQGGKVITAMTSDEGECYRFERPIKPEGNVEDWMGRVEEEMKRTLHIHCKKAVYLYAREDDRIKWIKSQLGMVAILGTQIWWTFAVEDVFRRVKTDKYAMKEELARESQEINRLVALIREEGVTE